MRRRRLGGHAGPKTPPRQRQADAARTSDDNDSDAEADELARPVPGLSPGAAADHTTPKTPKRRRGASDPLVINLEDDPIDVVRSPFKRSRHRDSTGCGAGGSASSASS